MEIKWETCRILANFAASRSFALICCAIFSAAMTALGLGDVMRHGWSGTRDWNSELSLGELVQTDCCDFYQITSFVRLLQTILAKSLSQKCFILNFNKLIVSSWSIFSHPFCSLHGIRWKAKGRYRSAVVSKTCLGVPGWIYISSQVELSAELSIIIHPEFHYSFFFHVLQCWHGRVLLQNAQGCSEFYLLLAFRHALLLPLPSIMHVLAAVCEQCPHLTFVRLKFPCRILLWFQSLTAHQLLGFMTRSVFHVPSSTCFSHDKRVRPTIACRNFPSFLVDWTVWSFGQQTCALSHLCYPHNCCYRHWSYRLSAGSGHCSPFIQIQSQRASGYRRRKSTLTEYNFIAQIISFF